MHASDAVVGLGGDTLYNYPPDVFDASNNVPNSIADLSLAYLWIIIVLQCNCQLSVAVQHAMTTSSSAATAAVFQTVGSVMVLTIVETCLMSRTADD